MSSLLNRKKGKNALVFILCIYLQLGYAQMAIPFKERYKANVRGDMTIIANSILNRIDKKSSPNDAYNDLSIEAITNDEIDMEYIDIDQDKSTFSSSSAALFQKNEVSKKIVYAGLYWSATYKYESGYKKGEDKFVAFDKSREPFDEVLVKFPDQQEYQKVKGEVIFDGLEDKKFKDASPYAAYADITEFVKALDNPFGFYTVANIRATQGTLIGGTAAGWTMIFVYEDPTMSEKFVCSYDGFAGASSQSVDILFQNFTSMPEGNVVAKLACSALEGDFKVNGDMMMIASSTNPSFSNIKTLTRPYSNFFNSSITMEDEHFRYRIPDSKNTLGYDALLTTLKNPNNKIIANNAKQVALKFKSSGDVFYLFFAALTIEIKKATTPVEDDNTKVVFEDDKFKLIDKTTGKEIVAEVKDSTQVVAESQIDSSLTQKNTIAEVQKPEETAKPATTKRADVTAYVEEKEKTPEPEKVQPKAIVETKVPKETTPAKPAEVKEKVIAEPKPKPIQEVVKPKVEPKVESKPDVVDAEKPAVKNQQEAEILNNIDAPKGYYLVANVFNERVNAARFMMSVRKKGLNPNYFINPLNNYMYVYLDFVPTREAAEALLASKLNNQYTEEMWILIVNMKE